MMNESVKNYLKKLPSPQRQICKRLRKIILDTFPDIEESFKNGVPWYEDKYYIVGLKDHVNLGFAIEGLTKEELDLFQGRGKIMRHLEYSKPDQIDKKEIVGLLKIVK